MVRHLPMYEKIPNCNQSEIQFLLISAKLRSLDPTLIYCLHSDWTTLSIGGKKWVSLRMNIFGVLHGKASTHVWQNPQLKSMGNTVSAHICQIKVVRPYPVILYELRLDHSFHWWKKIGVPRKKPNLAYSMVRHLPMYDKIPNWNQWEILFLLISAKLRSLVPTLLYCINPDWTTLSIRGKKLVSLGTTKFGVLDGKTSTHVWQNTELK